MSVYFDYITKIYIYRNIYETLCNFQIYFYKRSRLNLTGINWLKKCRLNFLWKIWKNNENNLINFFFFFQTKISLLFSQKIQGIVHFLLKENYKWLFFLLHTLKWFPRCKICNLQCIHYYCLTTWVVESEFIILEREECNCPLNKS